MRTIRTIVVDDEPASRSRIVRLLEQDKEFNLVAECRNGQEALEAVRKLRPDLMFLDVQMPEKTGFELVSEIPTERMPFVVFVTAHDRYALKAFDVDAVDFLLKPFDDERFLAAVEKAKRFMAMRTSSRLTGRLMELVRDHMHTRSPYTEVFVVRDRGREHKVAADDLVFIRAEGNYVLLQTMERRVLHRITMSNVQEELDPERFLRIHRRYLVNQEHVRGTRYTGNNEFVFTMSNGEQIVSGRSYKEQIAERLRERNLS
jgi:two-component system LytT family response regulator